jgi:hypothetical protein
MAYSITPTSGINLDAIVATNPNSAGTEVPVNGPLGSQVFGSDGLLYVLAVADATIAASTAVCDIDPDTFEVAATGGAYTSPAVALASGDYAWFSKASV